TPPGRRRRQLRTRPKSRLVLASGVCGELAVFPLSGWDWTRGALSVELAQVAHGAAIGAGGQLGVGLERRRDPSRALLFRLEGALRAARSQGLFIHQDFDGALRDIDTDPIAGLHQRDGPAGGRLGRHVTDGKTAGTTRKAAVR